MYCASTNCWSKCRSRGVGSKLYAELKKDMCRVRFSKRGCFGSTAEEIIIRYLQLNEKGSFRCTISASWAVNVSIKVFSVLKDVRKKRKRRDKASQRKAPEKIDRCAKLELLWWKTYLDTSLLRWTTDKGDKHEVAVKVRPSIYSEKPDFRKVVKKKLMERLY